MGKKAAKKSTTTGIDPTQGYIEVFDARSQIVAASINMGWQLALTVLIPLFLGVKLDQYFDSSPSLTLTALFIAVTGSAILIVRTFKDISREQDRVFKTSKRKRTLKRVKNV